MYNKKQIQALMAINPGMTEEEAKAVLDEDAEIDKMTSIAQVNSDLTPEQQKVMKEARRADRKPNEKAPTKRPRKENPDKRALIETIKNALENAGCESIQVTNIEREIVFQSGETKYKIVLSAPRT